MGKETTPDNDSLMQRLPDGVEEVEVKGPFLIRRYPGSFAVIVQNSVLVTCGGDNARESASEIAKALNSAWREQIVNPSTSA